MVGLFFSVSPCLRAWGPVSDFIWGNSGGCKLTLGHQPPNLSCDCLRDLCTHTKSEKKNVEVSFKCYWKWKWSRSVVSDSVTPWIAAYQAPPSMGISRQEYWSRLPFPSPGDLPDPGIKPRDRTRSPALEADTLTSEPPGKPSFFSYWG